jgi:hypothetical protein
MPRVVVINHVTLDGVMQAPGRPDEDTRGGFEHGGWASSRMSGDEAMSCAMDARMASSSGVLFGRRTYDDLLSYWNSQDSPFKGRAEQCPQVRRLADAERTAAVAEHHAAARRHRPCRGGAQAGAGPGAARHGQR